jgi:hypothetical protein
MGTQRERNKAFAYLEPLECHWLVLKTLEEERAADTGERACREDVEAWEKGLGREKRDERRATTRKRIEERGRGRE